MKHLDCRSNSLGETPRHTYSKNQVIIREQVVCTAGLWINLPRTKPTRKRKHPVERARHPTRKTARNETEPHLQGLGARIGTGRQVEQGPVLGPRQETIESFHETISLGGIVASEVLEVGAHEDQTACAALAFGGGDPGLGAQDLAFEVVALASLGLQQLFFPCFELPLEGLLAIQELLEFFLWLHGDRW